ncbi:P2Y purinoceptor 2-like [Pelobates fuscus]|uniref:P2Y purinoceptor 2-like n=1 Tax=Pelobates fuscus TaxID=191477 RepID=UPI002FE4DFCF
MDDMIRVFWKNRCIINEDVKYILLCVSYGVVFCIGFVLNVLTLYIFLFRIRPWKTVNVFMFNLALSDLLYVLSLPLLVHYYSKENDWIFGMVVCKLIRFLFYTSLYCSILFLLCISVYRFLAVCYPVQYLRWGHVRFAKIASLIIWVIIIGMQSPMLYFVNTTQLEGNTICPDTSNTDKVPQFLVFQTVNLVLLFCVPFTAILICYCNIVHVLIKPNTNSSQPCQRKKSTVKMIIVVLIVFIICFLPFHVTRTLFYYYRITDLDCSTLNAINMAYTVTRPLASFNSCIDPILYFFVWKLRQSAE